MKPMEAFTVRRVNPRENGIALILALVLMVGLLGFTAVSMDITKAHSAVRASEQQLFAARLISESGLAQALARYKEAGQAAPVSGDGTDAAWVPFSTGEYYYTTELDVPNEGATIRSWARVPITDNPSGSLVSPDDPNWDGTGYVTQGVEIALISSRYIPETPAYFGNGGIEKPLGGFSWGSGVDPFDPSTWQTVNSNPSSWQTAAVPFQVNALDHPTDYLYNGGAPTPATPGVHDYAPWVSQTAIGQANIEAWMQFSADGGSAMSGFTPSPVGSYSNDPNSPDYVFPIDPIAADVQDYSWDLWNTFQNDPSVPKLNSGNQSGTYGTQTDPGITMVTGTLRVPAGETFEGSGILVIRDDFDPNQDSNNTPSTSAALDVYGDFRWTGLVIIAGWRPNIKVRPGGDATVVGTLMGEDSVMSGGEVSLNSATITMKIEDDLRLLYSHGLFEPGSFVYDHLPLLRKNVVGAKELYAN
jgi:hypothetical protein